MSLFLLLLVCTTLKQVVSNRVYYIVPSQDIICSDVLPGETCLTLEDYISSSDTTPNISLELLPGDHTIDSTLSVSEKESFVMHGTNATLNCMDPLKFNFSNQIYISELKFNNCFSEVISVVNFTLDNCDLYNSSLTLHWTEAMVTQSVFQDLGSGTDFGPESGALSVHNSTLKVDRSTFTDCKASKEAPAIHSRSSTLTVEHSSFENNIHRQPGRDFSSTNTHGGAINFDNGTLTISGSDFIGNSAGGYPYSSGSGGAVYVKNAIFTVHTSNYINNIADDSGGAIASGVRSPASFHTSVFSDNVARGSGGALAFSSNTVVVNRSNFTNNRAGFDAGAILSASITISESVFIGNGMPSNSFGGHGGAIYVSSFGKVLSTYKVTFLENTARFGRGGVIYSRGRDINISLVETTFSHSLASICGVLETKDLTLGHLNILRSSFTNNRATNSITFNIVPRRGGGVFCIRGGTISITNSTFSHNSVAGDAGVFEVEESSMAVEQSEFSNNTADGNGGVMSSALYSTFFTFDSSSFNSNQAGTYGGVIYVGSSSSQLNIRDSYFSFNNAIEAGGAIAIRESVLDLADSSFLLNMASLGGVLSACASQVTLSIEQDLFDSTNSSCVFYDDHSDFVTSTTSLPNTPIVTQTQPIAIPTHSEFNTALTPTPTAVNINSMTPNRVATSTILVPDTTPTPVAETPTPSKMNILPTRTLHHTATQTEPDVTPTPTNEETNTTPSPDVTMITPTTREMATPSDDDITTTPDENEVATTSDTAQSTTTDNGVANVMIMNPTVIFSFSFLCFCVLI